MNDNLHEQHNQQPQHENTDNISSPDSEENKSFESIDKRLSTDFREKKNQQLSKLLLIFSVLIAIGGFTAYKFFTASPTKIEIKSSNKDGDEPSIKTGLFTPPSKVDNSITTQKDNKDGKDAPEVSLPPVNIVKKSEGFSIISNGSSQNNNNTKDVTNIEKKAPNEKPNSLYTLDSFKPTEAFKSNYNPNLLLSKGTYISCNLRSKFVSNISGQISCIISDDIYSESGNVVLIEKGSLVFGSYNGGNVGGGNNEMMAIWQQIKTPNNLVINIDSGSADELGAAGMKGNLDTHFMRRFRDALFVSSITDLISAASSKLSKQGNQNYLSDTNSQTNSLFQTILSQQNIQPTLTKNQGDKVGIYVARDVDFSSVYKLERY